MQVLNVFTLYLPYFVAACAPKTNDYALVLGGSGDQSFLTSMELVTGEFICIPMMEEFPYKGDSDMEAVYFDDKLLVCGGWNYDKESCYVYDWTEGWSETEPEKTRRFFDMVVLGDQVLAMGGMGLNDEHDGEIIRDTIAIFTFESGWTTNPEWKLPKGLWRFCAVSVDSENVVIVGGFESSDGTIESSVPNKNVYKFNTVSGTFEDLSPVPSVNNLLDHSCTLYQYYDVLGLLVVPGDTRSDAPTEPNTYFYNLETAEWELLPPMVHPRYNHKMVVVEGKPTVIGGWYDGREDIIEEFDGVNWSVREDVLVDKRSGHVAVGVPAGKVDCI